MTITKKKTKRGVSVPGHPVALAVLNYLKKLTPASKRLVFLPDTYMIKYRPYRIYRRAMGTSIDNTQLSETDHLRKDIDFYSFRHTCRSAMEACGVQTAIAETIIGHNENSFKFTYIHGSDEDLLKEIKKLNYPGLKIDFPTAVE